MTLILVVVGASCVRSQKYPNTWPPLVRGDKNHCPSVSGSFVDQADPSIGADRDAQPSLSKVLFGNVRWIAKHGQTVTDPTEIVHLPHARMSEAHCDFVLTPEDLRIGCWQDSTEPKMRVVPSSDFSCTKFGLKFKAYYSGDETSQFNYVVTVARDDDGALIVKLREAGVDTLFILPVAWSYSQWLRYPSLDTAKNERP